MNLDAYLQRIGYSGPVAPTLAVLKAIVFAQATSIPFENLDVLSDAGISLSPDHIEQKIVGDRRGGYCFELNNLLRLALVEIGFHVESVSARVSFTAPPGTTAPRTHLFHSVMIEGSKWFVDVGVGGLTVAKPLRWLDDGTVQETPHEPRRFIRKSADPADLILHQVDLGNKWATLCEFTSEPMPLVDQEIANWWTSTSPDSKFRNNLIVASTNRDGTRFNLTNDEFIHRQGAEILARVEVKNRDELRLILEERFALPLPDQLNDSILGFA